MLYSDAFDHRCGVGVLRLRNGLDHSPAKSIVTGGTHCSSIAISFAFSIVLSPYESWDLLTYVWLCMEQFWLDLLGAVLVC